MALHAQSGECATVRNLPILAEILKVQMQCSHLKLRKPYNVDWKLNYIYNTGLTIPFTYLN
jgi:hypothetical protein